MALAYSKAINVLHNGLEAVFFIPIFLMRIFLVEKVNFTLKTKLEMQEKGNVHFSQVFSSNELQNSEN